VHPTSNCGSTMMLCLRGGAQARRKKREVAINCNGVEIREGKVEKLKPMSMLVLSTKGKRKKERGGEYQLV